MLARASRDPGLLVGALIIDIDWFKDVNEKLGRGAGDQVLKIVAERLETVVRARDSVGRLDGDEFVILVEAAAPRRAPGRARAACDRVAAQAGRARRLRPGLPADGEHRRRLRPPRDPEDLFRDAHLALDAAKAAGKDRYTLFNANMRSVIEGEAVLEAELNAALQDKQFFLLYQPMCDLTSHKVVGLEAMIRWQHPPRASSHPRTSSRSPRRPA